MQPFCKCPMLTNKMKYDIVLPVALNHINISFLAIHSLIKNANTRKIYVITEKKNFLYFSTLIDEGHPIILLDQNSLIDSINIENIENYIKCKGENPNRGGWYLQQFIKMGACYIPNISDYYLVWDSDTIMVRPITFISNDGNVFIYTISEYNPLYFDIYYDTYYKIFRRNRSVNFSYISNHFMIKKEYMKELIVEIENNFSSDKSWVWKII